MFEQTYSGKTVLLTGNTGFKGSWLTIWLIKMGAKVVGLSDDIPTEPSLYKMAKLESLIDMHYLDIRDTDAVKNLVTKVAPDYVFHLAAQPLVKASYDNPLATLSTNIMGTASILESLRELDKTCSAVIVTSDKCYDNVEWCWGYKETDRLGGKDIYSGSKAAAELVFNSYFHSFFSAPESNVKLVTARAGNVIGGGDWASDRIVVDCIQKWEKKQAVLIRSPNATRPWQHVLEPLSGYLLLAQELAKGKVKTGESYNFGPSNDQNIPVRQLITDLFESFGAKGITTSVIVKSSDFHEAGLLKLNCEKAAYDLGWFPTLEYKECVNMVGSWYRNYLAAPENALELCLLDIDRYILRTEA